MPNKKLKWRISKGIDIKIKNLPEEYTEDDVEIIQED